MKFTIPMAALLACASAAAQVSSFDPATNLVTIPSVSVGAATFTAVQLRLRSDSTFELVGAAQQTPAAPGVAAYDVATSKLTLPAVKVGDNTFIDVKLQNTGNFVFVLEAVSPLPATVAAGVDAFVRAAEAQFATQVPTSGAERFALTDACWRSNGRTRANAVADFDANLQAYRQRDAYLVGRRLRNVQVLAVRTTENPDRSTRQEVDIEYEVVHTDGTTAVEHQRLVSGSSAGTPGCAVPQVSSAWRALGNQQLVQTAVRAHNLRDERYNLVNGAALSPAVTYRREVQFQITDPMGNATYVIVTGPGPTTTIGGVSYPFSMKFISPRLLMSAPEMQGKPGNFLNWTETDGFRNCRLASGALPVVHIVDCVADGATANSWGIGFTGTPDAAADQQFRNQGWVAGGVYRFDVYNDDGWKTVNGHASRTPAATYYDTLERLPFSFVEMAGRYPVFQRGSLTPAQIAANAVLAAPQPLSLSWTRPEALPNGRPMHLNQVWEFHQGARIGNAGTAFNPAYRTLNRSYPGSTSTGTTAFPVTPRQPDQANKSYTEYMLYFVDPTNGNAIQSRLSFQ